MDKFGASLLRKRKLADSDSIKKIYLFCTPYRCTLTCVIHHDEPLKGDRKGQRSIRLSRSYRAIYRVVKDHVVFILVEEVNKHEYQI